MFWVSDQLWIRYDIVLFDSSPQYFVCLPSATMSCRIPFQCFCSSAHQGWSCHLRNGTSSDCSAVISNQRHVWSLDNPHLCLAVLDIMKRGDWREILHIPRRQPATTWMLFLEDVITWQHIIQKNKNHQKLYELWLWQKKNLLLANKSLDQSLDHTTKFSHNLQIPGK